MKTALAFLALAIVILAVFAGFLEFISQESETNALLFSIFIVLIIQVWDKSA